MGQYMLYHVGITLIFHLCLTVCFIRGDDECSTIKPAKLRPCPEGMRDDGVSCWKDSYGRGAGRIPDKSPCENGQRDDGTSCWLDSYGRGAGRIPDKAPCPPGLRDDGTSCWSDAHIYGKGCCCTLWGCCNKCKSGYHDDGCTCRKVDVGIKLTLFQRQKCQDHEEKNGALCYPKCKTGFHPVGCCICQPHGGPRIVKTLPARQTCKETEDKYGALCYPKCKDGYRPVGCCICEPNDGPGIKITHPNRLYCEGKDFLFNGVCIDREGCSPTEIIAELQNNMTLSESMIDRLKEEIPH